MFNSIAYKRSDSKQQITVKWRPNGMSQWILSKSTKITEGARKIRNDSNIQLLYHKALELWKRHLDSPDQVPVAIIMHFPLWNQKLTYTIKRFTNELSNIKADICKMNTLDY